MEMVNGKAIMLSDEKRDRAPVKKFVVYDPESGKLATRVNVTDTAKALAVKPELKVFIDDMTNKYDLSGEVVNDKFTTKTIVEFKE